MDMHLHSNREKGGIENAYPTLSMCFALGEGGFVDVSAAAEPSERMKCMLINARDGCGLIMHVWTLWRNVVVVAPLRCV